LKNWKEVMDKVRTNIKSIRLLREDNPLKKKLIQNHAYRLFDRSGIDVPLAEHMDAIVTNGTCPSQRTLEICPSHQSHNYSGGMIVADNGNRFYPEERRWDFGRADDKSITFETKDRFFPFVIIHYRQKDLERECRGSYVLREDEKPEGGKWINEQRKI
jgi:hypothetical protein